MAQPQHPHKPAKPLHPADLPDPLSDSRDVPMASADDLLSEIVDDDVERLMSGEYDPIVTPGHKAVERLQHQIGKFLDEVRQREQAAAPPPPQPAAPRPAPVPLARPRAVIEEEIAAPLEDLVGPTREQLIGLHSGEYEAMDTARGPAESRALLAPVDESANDSALLKPLDWVSAPVAAMSGRSRVAVSMLAVLSFLGGCAALGYVLMLRHGS